MPHFLDLFLQELHEKRDAFHRRLSGDESSELDGRLKTAFQGEWNDLPPAQKLDLRVIAVDSGRATRDYASGTFMYICRASAYTSWGASRRKVTSNAHIMASTREQLNDLVSLRSEHVEHQAALEAIRETSEVDLVLIDGSLYGRITHVPISFNYPGEEELYLRYMQTFIQLLEECRKRKILVLGVSKDSVARHLTRFLLEGVKTKVLKDIEQLLSPEDFDQLITYMDAEQRPSIAGIRFIREVGLPDKQRELLGNLFYELRHPRPDFHLIKAWAETKGYTSPIEPYPDVPLFKYESKNPADYVRRRFVNAYNNYEHEEDFEKWAIPVMKEIFQLPTFVTVCVNFHHKDTPLRIDVPAFNVGLPTRFSQVTSSRMLSPPPPKVLDILGILRGEYGGPELYNVYLVRADQEARLPVNDVTTLYEPLVEKELKEPLIPRRRDRRLRYG